jgi:hypothetical protein
MVQQENLAVGRGRKEGSRVAQVVEPLPSVRPSSIFSIAKKRKKNFIVLTITFSSFIFVQLFWVTCYEVGVQLHFLACRYQGVPTLLKILFSAIVLFLATM